MPSQHTLQTRGLGLGYGEREIISGLDVDLPPGRVTVVVGPNACGKSTLLRAMARLLAPTAGAVLLDGKDIHRTPPRQVAATLGMLPQSPVAPDAITVADLVGRGRYPHQGWFRRWTAADSEGVAAAMLATDVMDLADRSVDELSGGQRQRVWIAMALAQETDILLLDEPTTYLDISHQLDVLDLLTDLNRDRGVTLAVVLHDLNLACRYADHLIAMKAGRVVAEGAPADIVTESLVREVFGLRSTVVPDPASGTPMVVPLGRHHVPSP
ncbi:ABC transporter ATP-binding protein [Streptomyces griseoviridis]|uniref:Cobalamin/Fe3+-siderophore ABC transporter ATP-binding protein n=3 Tax=Streptomyces TaxID=1883 RepID=A0A918GW11_STRGD|nr:MULTISPECIES: ABC transporter ATP-binding protein [Streptomyces]MDP9679839.1 iron complex transport system ATP-binding protein [Streptomyces griseoviridis]GGS63315.1 cobalamin/Fe3+-siderophore ABC transporter ATP-binding protein [Streptomyces niveoruber]GGT24413.1 cobalamin/Fe3+-siderophore ABC transporter ATP-binding protein [Streptomyces griseoviridis]GGU58723.1 cobalamin/Fe3+-siderophore ABC transporter ATP-binding protein [Streptomyces daghestanicus]GHI30115.1 cobalamin/Fe3+-siderophore